MRAAGEDICSGCFEMDGKRPPASQEGLLPSQRAAINTSKDGQGCTAPDPS